MSIYLNKDDIQNIDSAATQQKILKAVFEHIKEIATTETTAIEIDIYPTSEELSTSQPMFTKESSFLELIGSVDGPSDLAENHDNYLN
jgi:hypothetical protein